MGWKEVKVEEQKLDFINACLQEQASFTELCQKYEISRKTGYKWLKRFQENGKEGLNEHARTPLTNPHEVTDDIITKILEVKSQYRHFGPKKIHAVLGHREPLLRLPCINTIGNILSRHGLVIPRRFRRRVPATAPLGHCLEANNVWSYDFKGWFKTENGQKCEPFTLSDQHTRYLLRCSSLRSKTAKDVWSVFASTFMEYGLPNRVRSDNGSPFATNGAGRLSSLSVLLIKAGVIPEWISPGKPQENGRHERLHLTLQAETACPPAKTLNEQEKRFRQFQYYYNHERPHEALRQQTPSSMYTPSGRVWDGKLRSPEYSEPYETRKVGINGLITWKNREIFISETLYKECVGIIEQGDGDFNVYYGPIFLGQINLRKEFIKDKLIWPKVGRAIPHGGSWAGEKEGLCPSYPQQRV